MYEKVYFTACFICGLLSFSGCTASTEYLNINQYDEIKSLSDIYINDSVLFPESVKDLEVEKFYCKITTYPLSYTNHEILLTVKYDSNGFERETERIKKIGNSDITKNYFSNTCYATLWNVIDTYEYAIIGDNTISYVYLQFDDKKSDDITLERKYLPQNYNIKTDKAQYTAYNYLKEYLGRVLRL